MTASQLTEKDIKKLFTLLNDELKRKSFEGELYLVGGAVMCLAYHARHSTRDVDGLFLPAKSIREAAKKVAAKAHVNPDWLNDAVKGYLSDKGEFEIFLELSHLKVMVAKPEYLLAMKCLAMRIGEGLHDLDDVRYLLRYLNIEKYDKALDIITRYYPKSRFPQKTLYALEEIING